MAAGKKTGGRVAGTPNKRKRQAVVAEAIARVGETIPNAFAGDAYALLVAVYKDPRQDLHTRLDAAKAALPYEKPRLQAVTLANQGASRSRCCLNSRSDAGWRSSSSSSPAAR